MTDREAIVKALKCLVGGYAGGCEQCAYQKYSRYRYSCQTAAALDALNMLEAQETRVMTFEELQNLCEGDVIWAERRFRRDNGYVDLGVAAMMRSHNNKLVCGGLEIKIDANMFSNVYGEILPRDEFRYWTIKPSDELRKGVAWE